MTAGLRVGLADHLGWAVAVTVSADREVVDRRRLELLEAGVPNAPVEHDAQGLDPAAAAALVAEVRASAGRAAAAGLDQLARDLGAPIRSVSLRDWPPDFPDDLAVLRRAPWSARADAVMYRQVVAEVAHDRGWEVHLYDARSVVPSLGGAVDLDAPRARLGPPWTKDHRTALAAALAAGAGV